MLYHLVLMTKNGHPVIEGDIKECLYSKIQQNFLRRGLQILEINGESDYIHILFEADPDTDTGDLVHALKVQTSRWVWRWYGDTELTKWYQEPCFWSSGYFVMIAKENSLAVVQEYIQNQRRSMKII